MQRGLICDRAGQKRVAVVLQRDGQPLKPICPSAIQMALDPDLIDYSFTCIGFRDVFLRLHFSSFVADRLNGLCYLGTSCCR
jgi:hypothetical protein